MPGSCLVVITCHDSIQGGGIVFRVDKTSQDSSLTRPVRIVLL